jgi:hypothetical protein
MDTAPWPLFKERGWRIGRMTDCDHQYMNGEVECLTCVAAWTCLWPCTVASLLAHSRNPINQPIKRPHCGHGIAAIVGCPCSMCIIRNNLRQRHDLGQAKCAVWRDCCACLFCCPCMVAQFSRATFPWEWVPCEPVPSNPHAFSGGSNPRGAVTGTVVGGPFVHNVDKGEEHSDDEVPADIERFESVDVGESNPAATGLNPLCSTIDGGRESPCDDDRASAPGATPDTPGSMH